MKTLLPPGWPRPKGYSNGIGAPGRLVVTAGVVGWDEQEHFVSNTLAGQFEQVLKNIVAILAEDGAGPEHLVRLTCYVTSIDAYLASLERDRRGLEGDHRPPLSGDGAGRGGPAGRAAGDGRDRGDGGGGGMS